MILCGWTIQRSIAIAELTNNLKPIVYKYNTCAFCVKTAITTLSSVQSEIRLLNDHSFRLEAAKSDHKLQNKKDDLGSLQTDLGSLSEKLKSISGLFHPFCFDASSGGNKPLVSSTSKLG